MGKNRLSRRNTIELGLVLLIAFFGCMPSGSRRIIREREIRRVVKAYFSRLYAENAAVFSIDESRVDTFRVSFSERHSSSFRHQVARRQGYPNWNQFIDMAATSIGRRAVKEVYFQERKSYEARVRTLWKKRVVDLYTEAFTDFTFDKGLWKRGFKTTSDFDDEALKFISLSDWQDALATVRRNRDSQAMNSNQ
jgi:hypothetical protein